MATGVWQTEAKQWYDWDSIIMTGTPKKREEQRREFLTSNVQIMITNFALLGEVVEMSQRWNNIIIDEAHLGGLLNHNNETYKTVKKLQSINLFILTGTPVRKGPQDLWSLLHLLQPKKFTSYWGYVNKYCHVLQGQFGKEILGRPKDVRVFNDMLYQQMVRNLKKDVLPDLPDKQRIPLLVDMEPIQLAAYIEILEEMMLVTDTDVLLTPNRMTQDMRLRQLLVCPRILGIPDDGIALKTIAEYSIPQQFDAGRAVVVTTPFRQAVPYIREAIERSLPGTYIEEIHGAVKENTNNIAKRFQAHKSHKKVLIYTIKSGASWTAHTASTGFMLGSQWDVNENTQAEDRIHRIGQKNKVDWYYLLHKGTVDEAVMDKLNGKNDAQLWTLHAHEMLAKLESLKEKYREK